MTTLSNTDSDLPSARETRRVFANVGSRVPVTNRLVVCFGNPASWSSRYAEMPASASSCWSRAAKVTTLTFMIKDLRTAFATQFASKLISSFHGPHKQLAGNKEKDEKSLRKW